MCSLVMGDSLIYNLRSLSLPLAPYRSFSIHSALSESPVQHWRQAINTLILSVVVVVVGQTSCFFPFSY